MQEQYSCRVEEQSQGQRLDVFIAAVWPQLSRSAAQRLINGGNVRINGEVHDRVSRKLRDGDQVDLEIPEAADLILSPEDIPLDIYYEDSDIVVVNKSVGMVVHPAAGHYQGTMVNALLAHCDDLSGINGVLRPGIVHRLDKDTSGLLMVAKNDKAHRNLTQQLQDRQVKRRYLALVHGVIRENSGRIEAPIGRDPRDRQKMAVTHQNSKEAITYYQVLQRYPTGFTWLELRLATGRTHQIRVHLAYIGHPVAGDPRYGPAKPAFGLTGQFLHAHLLGFHHPRTGEYLEFRSPMPTTFQIILSEASIAKVPK